MAVAPVTSTNNHGRTLEIQKSIADRVRAEMIETGQTYDDVLNHVEKDLAELTLLHNGYQWMKFVRTGHGNGQDLYLPVPPKHTVEKGRNYLMRLSLILHAVGIPDNDPIIDELRGFYENFPYPPQVKPRTIAPTKMLALFTQLDRRDRRNVARLIGGLLTARKYQAY